MHKTFYRWFGRCGFKKWMSSSWNYFVW
jgi:hypothetical protein